jgi:YggT family protein
MGLLTSLIKFYLVVLILRTAMTRQELYFNPLGKLVGKVTDPLLEKTFKLTKKSADNALPLFIGVAIVLVSLVYFMLTTMSIPVAFLAGMSDVAKFLMLFYMVSVIMGSFAGNASMSHYAMFFHRIAAFWVKLTRTFIPIKSNKIVFPAVIVVFAAFTLILSVINLGFQYFEGIMFSFSYALTFVFKDNIYGLLSLIDIFIWLIIIRALLSWVSPDPRNPVVQLIAALTDPIMEPFRKIIPNIGGIDLSPMLLIFIVYYLKSVVIRLLEMAF